MYAIWRGWGGAASGESRVRGYSPSLHHRAIHSVLVRLCFCHFAEYGCLLSPLGIRVKRSLLGLLMMHILNDGFYKPLENQLQLKLKDQDPVISPSSHLTRTIFRSETSCGGEEKDTGRRGGGDSVSYWSMLDCHLHPATVQLMKCKGTLQRAPSEPSLSASFPCQVVVTQWKQVEVRLPQRAKQSSGAANNLPTMQRCPPSRGQARQTAEAPVWELHAAIIANQCLWSDREILLTLPPFGVAVDVVCSCSDLEPQGCEKKTYQAGYQVLADRSKEDGL